MRFVLVRLRDHCDARMRSECSRYSRNNRCTDLQRRAQFEIRVGLSIAIVVDSANPEELALSVPRERQTNLVGETVVRNYSIGAVMQPD